MAWVAAGWPCREARAGKYDLDLTRLGTQNADGTITQDNAAFRSLSSELGQLMAPKPADPADSLGLSGFAVSADVSVNTLAGGDNFWEATTGNEADNVAPTIQLMGRKGLYPGLEIGGGAVHLFDSQMWAMSGYLKLAFHEGFHRLPIPSIAVRGTVSRLLGAKDFNLTTVAPNLTISHVFGLGKTFSLTPYVGWEPLFIISRSTVLDATPNCDEFSDNYNEECEGINRDGQNEFVFKNGGAIARHRLFFGGRMIFSVIRLGFEAMFVPRGDQGPTIQGEIAGENVDDNSKFQQTYTLSIGLDF